MGYKTGRRDINLPVPLPSKKSRYRRVKKIDLLVFSFSFSL